MTVQRDKLISMSCVSKFNEKLKRSAPLILVGRGEHSTDGTQFFRVMSITEAGNLKVVRLQKRTRLVNNTPAQADYIVDIDSEGIESAPLVARYIKKEKQHKVVSTGSRMGIKYTYWLSPKDIYDPVQTYTEERYG